MATDGSFWSLVYRNAPLLFHGTDKGAIGQRVNSITRVDFLGGWDHVAENPQRARREPLPAWAYYEVLAGSRYTHLVVMLYHPIDKKFLPLGVGDHPQDLEWILIVHDAVQDRVVAAVTLFHELWYWGYVEEAGVTPRTDFFNVRPLIIDQPTTRPMIHVQNGGHGIRPYDPKRQDEVRIIYTPNTQHADVPTEIPWPRIVTHQKTIRYRLERITTPGGLWAHRNDPKVFAPVGRHRRLVTLKKGTIVASPATPVWCTGLGHDLVRIRVGGETRWLSPIVLDPNAALRKAFRGIARDPVSDNPFLL
jgi:hypothetical protein